MLESCWVVMLDPGDQGIFQLLVGCSIGEYSSVLVVEEVLVEGKDRVSSFSSRVMYSVVIDYLR